jgi:hypothetical protein
VIAAGPERSFSPRRPILGVAAAEEGVFARAVARCRIAHSPCGRSARHGVASSVRSPPQCRPDRYRGVVHVPGVGKTALLEYVSVQALGFRVVRSGGVESEMELPFAAVHQLCLPLLKRVDRLPEPQAVALRTSLE